MVNEIETKVISMDRISSVVIDARRVADELAAQWSQIKNARVRLDMALKAGPGMKDVHIKAALHALRGLGEE